MKSQDRKFGVDRKRGALALGVSGVVMAAAALAVAAPTPVLAEECLLDTNTTALPMGWTVTAGQRATLKPSPV
ncbi:MAG: hypothetical protein D6771_01805, partial [Zetaproteobacteria bacterium]